MIAACIVKEVRSVVIARATLPAVELENLVLSIFEKSVNSSILKAPPRVDPERNPADNYNHCCWKVELEQEVVEKTTQFHAHS